MPRLIFAFLFASLMTAELQTPTATAEGADHAAAAEPFQPSENRMADVDGVIARAKTAGKLAMIVMGANWCHDSIGFATHANDPAVAAVLADKYEMIYLDVGYLEHGRKIISRFGMPVIYGTPTVLIIDPASERLLNRDTMFRWRESAAMTAREAAKLLADQPRSIPAPAASSAELERLLGEIDAFEQAQAERIYGGFKVIGPMLAGDRSPNFYEYWNQLRDLRYTITGDLARLRREARDRAATGETGITLQYPEYPPFSWE